MKTFFYLMISLIFLHSCEVDQSINKEEPMSERNDSYNNQARFNLTSILDLSKTKNPFISNIVSKDVPIEDLPPLETKAISAYLVEERTLECGKSYIYVANATNTSAYDRMVWITIKKNTTTIDNQYVIIPAGQQTNSIQFYRVYANVSKPYPVADAVVSVTNIIEFSPNTPNVTDEYIKNSNQQYIQNCISLYGNPDFCQDHGGDANHNGVCDDIDKIIKETQEVDTSVD
ncbi:hypothetical protein OK18_11330 [Chryseobacterium gallinarum]|uniref:Uncharacterized protein n=1 Tax=Chryseobacterium gallinarum TaxID=1324352 RepID=A0A0G3M1U6_CHRGL|nr:hypothetical protein [Chryseobacterium gallinarum]AKK73126.1 hypothetical protein OK18_11330 [Chryseobacterium gallinarum]